jgi:hypothetical protein
VAEIARQRGIRPDQIETWFADEARIGQKNKLTRRWAKRGTRPIAPLDQRTASTYIFGAICPKEGKGAGLVLPRCNTEAMGLHLIEIAKQVARGKHAVLLLDQAGWHMSKKLVVPANITLMPLPAKCPEQSGFREAKALRCRPRGREYLAIHARQLAVEPDLYILREHHRTLLPGLEQAHRSAMAHHVHRKA